MVMMSMGSYTYTEVDLAHIINIYWHIVLGNIENYLHRIYVVTCSS